MSEVEGQPEDGAESIGRNTGFALTIQMTTAAFTAVLTVYLARALGPRDFGIFSLALALGAVLLLPADFGISGSTARFIAERRGNRAGVRELMQDASRLRLFTTGGICLALVALARPIADAYGEPDLAWALRGMSVTILGQSLMQLHSGAFTALGRLSLSFRMVLSKSVVETITSIAVVAAGGGAAGAAFGRGAGYVAGGTLGIVLMARLLRQRTGEPSGSDERVGKRRIAGYASALLLIEGAFVLFEQIDVLIIGGVLGAAAAGLFQAPLRLINFLHYPAYALAAGVTPLLAHHERHGTRVEPFEMAIRAVILFQALLIAPIVVWAGPIVELLLGPEYGESADVLRALAPYVFLAGLGPLVSMGVNYVGEARRRLPVAAAAVAINAAIDVVLIPEIGIIAGAIGTDVAYALYVPAHLWICKTVIDIALRPLLASLLRSLLAAGVMCGVLVPFGTSDVGVPSLLLGGALGTVAYAAVLLATREMSIQELQALWGAVRRRLPPSRP